MKVNQFTRNIGKKPCHSSESSVLTSRQLHATTFIFSRARCKQYKMQAISDFMENIRPCRYNNPFFFSQNKSCKFNENQPNSHKQIANDKGVKPLTGNVSDRLTSRHTPGGYFRNFWIGVCRQRS